MLIIPACRHSKISFKQCNRRYAVLSRNNILEANKAINALVSVASEDELSQPQNNSLPLNDFSVAVKDNICTANLPTTCSSKILGQFCPPFDATVVELLRNAGARVIGKANCDEFGMGSLNVHSSHGSVVNPHRPLVSAEQVRRSAGGSSGGSAAAVASGMSLVALGTDTGGSVRLPASYCGIVGLKPSYGLLSRWGVVSYADSLDCVGLLAQNVLYVSRVFDVLSCHDPKDPSAAPLEARKNAADACQSHLDGLKTASTSSGLRIGIPQEYFPWELDKNILSPFRRVVDALKSLGSTIVPVSMPATPYALSAYYVIASAEASSNLARYDGIQYGLRVEPPPGADLTKTSKIYAYTRSQGFGHEVRKRILLGTYALTADAFDNYFLQAQRLRQRVRRDFDDVFRMANPLTHQDHFVSAKSAGVDVLLHPSAIRTAPPLPDGEADHDKADEPLSSYLQDVLTVPASLAGVPAVSVPAGLADDGWPVGVSVVSQWGYDRLVLDVARTIEQSVPPNS